MYFPSIPNKFSLLLTLVISGVDCIKCNFNHPLINILQFTFPYDWNWKISLLLGGLLSATDPVAVVLY